MVNTAFVMFTFLASSASFFQFLFRYKLIIVMHKESDICFILSWLILFHLNIFGKVADGVTLFIFRIMMMQCEFLGWNAAK